MTTYIIQYSGHVDFPPDLGKYGLNESLLAKVFYHVQHHKKTHIPWELKGIPEIRFYKELHCFIKKWPVTFSASKATVGRLYLAIDKNLHVREFNPSHAYMFIDRLTSANQSRDITMNYYYGINETEMMAAKDQLNHCTKAMETLEANYNNMKKELERIKQDLVQTRCVLKDVTNQVSEMQQIALKQASQSHANYTSMNLKLIQEIENIQEKNSELSKALASVCKELSDMNDASITAKNAAICKTQSSGTRYSPAIQKLYYSLLAEQISPAKIGSVIKLKNFFPDLDTD